MEKAWYLHYDEHRIPSGFSRSEPTDTAYIMITEPEKLEIEKDPLRFLVLEGSLCRVATKRHDPLEYFSRQMIKAPKVGDWCVATDERSILLALTGFNTGKEFYIRIITERGETTILCPMSKRQEVIDVYHAWLANNNLKET